MFVRHVQGVRCVFQLAPTPTLCLILVVSPETTAANLGAALHVSTVRSTVEVSRQGRLWRNATVSSPPTR